MTSRDFCFWLQGFFEIVGGENRIPIGLTMSQTEVIRKHLALVFKHEIDPSMGDVEHQKELNEIHENPIQDKADHDEQMKELEKLLKQQKDNRNEDPVYRC